jgi:hypothetical protein
MLAMLWIAILGGLLIVMGQHDRSEGLFYVLGESRVMRNLLIEAQTREPAPGQVHAQFFHQFALAVNAVEIADQENA